MAGGLLYLVSAFSSTVIHPTYVYHTVSENVTHFPYLKINQRMLHCCFLGGPVWNVPWMLFQEGRSSNFS